MSQTMIDHEREVFKKLTGEFKHFCDDWDGMAIDETCHEFTLCHCSFGPTLDARKPELQLHLESICPRCSIDVEKCECTAAALEIAAIDIDDLFEPEGVVYRVERSRA